MLSFILNLTNVIGSTRSEVECIEESGTPVDDKYCKPLPRPDDRQKTCNEDPCPPMWVNRNLFLVCVDEIKTLVSTVALKKFEEYGVVITW